MAVLHFPEAAPADDLRAVARALVRIDDALEVGGPLIVQGEGAGFVIEGGIADAGLRRMWARTCATVTEHPQPVIAAAGGPLLDSGLELALACDLRFARAGAPVGFPATARGWLPNGGGQRLVRLAGSSAAARILLLGETPAAEALPRALAASDAPADDAARALAELEARGPLALEALKTALRAADELPLAAGLAIEADLACLLLDTADRAEGLDAFRDRRTPVFRGR